MINGDYSFIVKKIYVNRYSILVKYVDDGNQSPNDWKENYQEYINI
jgi:hypothetical protein